MYNDGIIRFDQIDLDNNLLNGNQLLQVTCELNNESFIDKKEIKNFLNELNYPLYYLDIEAIGSAVGSVASVKFHQV